ncbi:MAG TPA: response regulator [bacterium]|mgnify:FL=1|nr:response regulator [bacterium]HNS33861.1 response regulator [bacterium]HNZ73030.1 response regulator [bacterium]HOH67126.1 response regulator [bacterium]HQA63749.1 response regulator [bacterium]
MAEAPKKILLVEDDPMIVEMYKMRFEEEGFEVLVTDRGSEALEIASQQRPVAVLLDVILPEIDGFSILQNLKSSPDTRDIPVMLLTNLGQESDQEKGRQLGVADYFIKSQHTPADIIQRVNSIIINKTA